MKEHGLNIENLLLQKRELDQSISYASYIQKALLPSVDELKHAFTNSFVLYIPRDVVSGDFYWFNNQPDKLTIAVGDCTGHGVPGAFLSILGISFLDLVISKHKPDSPATFLNYLREYIMKALNQSGKPEEQKDGIDLSICMISKENQVISYSGSFNPLYIVRNGKLTQLDGDKMPVGIGAEMEHSFTSSKFELKKNDMVYMFSDGFPDQFGGPKGKKYKYPAFRDLLINCSNLTADEQIRQLKTELIEWKGAQPQLDDITILGFKI